MSSAYRNQEDDGNDEEQADSTHSVCSTEKKSIFTFLENRFRRLVSIKPCWGRLPQSDRSFPPSLSSSLALNNEEEKKDFSTASCCSLSFISSSPAVDEEKMERRKDLLDTLAAIDRAGEGGGGGEESVNEEAEEEKEEKREDENDRSFGAQQKEFFLPQFSSSSCSSSVFNKDSPYIYECESGRQASCISASSSTGAVAGSISFLSRDSSSLSLSSRTKGSPSTAVSMLSQGDGNGRIDGRGEDARDQGSGTIDRIDARNPSDDEEEEEEAQTVFSSETVCTCDIGEKANDEMKKRRERGEERRTKKERKAVLSQSDEDELKGLLQALQILSWNMTDREKSIWTEG